MEHLVTGAAVTDGDALDNETLASEMLPIVAKIGAADLADQRDEATRRRCVKRQCEVAAADGFKHVIGTATSGRPLDFGGEVRGIAQEEIVSAGYCFQRSF